MSLFFQPEIANGVYTLSPEESKHAVRVLRMAAGAALTITDGAGSLYSAKITLPDPSACGFEILTTTTIPAASHRVHIAIAPTKHTDRIEWFVEKAVELGVDQITFLRCHNSERTTLKLDRLEKIAISAMKQSEQARLVKLNPLVDFAQAMKIPGRQKFIAFVDPQNPAHLKNSATPNSEYVVLIGPEGDFSNDEMTLSQQQGFRKVTLGRNRLRTETAGLAACHILNLINT